MTPQDVPAAKKVKGRGRIRKSPKADRTMDGIVFDSIAEMSRYQELELLRAAGHIKDLELQPVFTFQINGRKIAKYIADFRYFDTVRQVDVIEDVKGHKDSVFRLKHKMFKAFFPELTLTLVPAGPYYKKRR